MKNNNKKEYMNSYQTK